MQDVSYQIGQLIIKQNFGNISESMIAAIHKDAQLRTYNAKSTILSEGSKSKGVYILLNGVAKAFTYAENGKEVILSLYGTGDSFGLKSVIEDGNFDKTVEVIEKAEVYFIPQETIYTVLKKHPSMLYSLLKKIDVGIGNLHNQAIALAQKSADERLAQALLMLRNKFGLDYEGYLLLNLSAANLAALVNTTRSSIYKFIKLFEDLGVIENNNGRIKICKEKQLLKSAGGLV